MRTSLAVACALLAACDAAPVVFDSGAVDGGPPACTVSFGHGIPTLVLLAGRCTSLAATTAATCDGRAGVSAVWRSDIAATLVVRAPTAAQLAVAAHGPEGCACGAPIAVTPGTDTQVNVGGYTELGAHVTTPDAEVWLCPRGTSPP